MTRKRRRLNHQVKLTARSQRKINIVAKKRSDHIKTRARTRKRKRRHMTRRKSRKRHDPKTHTSPGNTPGKDSPAVT